MTNEEAIKTLEANYPDACFEQLREAVDAAIEALKAQDADSDTISRKAAIDALDKRFDSIPMEQTTEILLLRKDLRELPSAQPETYEERTGTHACDLIDRQTAIDAVDKNRDTVFCNSVDYEGVLYDISNLPSAQPEIIHCGDCRYKDDGIDEDGIPFLKCLHGRSYGGTRINDFCSWAERRTDGD